MTNFAASAYSVMGDEDRSEFQFSIPLSDGKLLELLERNPRVAMMCDWMTAIALKNGHTLPPNSEEHLEKIHFKEKEHRAIMFARLHGSSMVRKYDNPIADKETEEGDIIEQTITTNCEVYHRNGNGNGWFLKSDDIGKNGQPKSFHLQIKVEKGKTKQIIVPAEECVIFKNPKKTERWDGTPSSKLIAHIALLEELLLKLCGKHALDIAGSFLHFDGVTSDEHAAAIHTAVSEKPLNELYTNGITITPMNNEVKGAMQDLVALDNMLKDYMACAMRVSRQAMDGAAEGTLSSAEMNTIMTSDTIEAIQSHYSPYIEDMLALLGYPDFKITWNKPIEKLDTKSNVNTDKPEGKNNVKQSSEE